jgi:hypothetical protein
VKPVGEEAEAVVVEDGHEHVTQGGEDQHCTGGPDRKIIG